MEELKQKSEAAMKLAFQSKQEQLNYQLEHQKSQSRMAKKLKEDSVAKHFNDSATVQERVSLMKASNRKRQGDKGASVMHKNQVAFYTGRKYEDCMKKMRELNFVPNINQYTFAAVASQNILSQERIMLCVPPGHGKSRVILTLPVLANDRFKSVLIIYTNEVLLRRDRPYLLSLQEMVRPLEISFRVQKDDVITVQDDTLVIVDEADEVFLDSKVALNAKYCIGLSATPLGEQDDTECSFITGHLKFALYDSGIASEVSLTTCVDPVLDLKAFMNLS